MHHRAALPVVFLFVCAPPAAATVHHYVYGLAEGTPVSVVQNGQAILTNALPGPAGDVQFDSPVASPISIFQGAPQSDVTAPSAVANLSAGSATISSLTLSWTAPGDDGASGTASQYDIRYATSPINATTFAAATQVAAEPAPAAAGTVQTISVSGLSSNTTYYFAMKAADEVPNWSSLSNVCSGTTLLPPDTVAPAAITNLAAGSPGATSVALTWTAPGDDGTVGTAAQYDVRYSPAPITAQNFASATAASGEPLPAASGANQGMTVSGLASGTTYYFAVKAADEVPNWAAISNVPLATTLPPADTTPPAAVTDLATGLVTVTSIALSWTAPGDDGATGTAAQYDVRYSTAAISATNFASAIQVPSEPAPGAAGTAQNMTVSNLASGTTYYFALKSADERGNWSPVSNTPSAATLLPSDTTPPASVANLAATASSATSALLTWTAPGDDGNTGTAAAYEVKRSSSPITAQNWANATIVNGPPAPVAAGGAQSMTATGLSPETVTYFALRARDEASNWSAVSNSDSTTTPPPPDTTPPSQITSLTAVALSESSIRVNWRATGDDGNSGFAAAYDLRRSTSTITASNWSQATPITGLPLPSAPGTTEQFIVEGLASSTRYYFAAKARDEAGNWSTLSANANAKTTTPPPADTTPPATITDLGVVSGTLTESAARLHWSAPGDDGSAGRAQAYEVRRFALAPTDADWGSGELWTSGVPAPSTPPAVEFLDLTGLTAQTAYCFAIRAVDEAGNWSHVSNAATFTTLPPPDTTPPAAITDLAAQPGASIGTAEVAWTEPGDDGTAGTVASIELRYRQDSLTPGDWPGATLLPVTFTPGPAGTHEHLTVTGLPAGATCALGVKAIDDAGNASPLSDVVIVALPAPDVTPPSAVTDLAALAAGSSAMTLAWTAPPDDRGTCVAYELRYSVAPASLSAWSAWTVSAAPPPSAAGSPETVTVSNLAPGTSYVFALRASDGVNWSALSNAATASTAPPPDLTPPAAVSDLAIGRVTANSIELVWTAVGDDGTAGTAAAYELRRSNAAVDPSTWAGAENVSGVPSPAASGSRESFVVTGLAPGATHHFALRVSDEAGNRSSLSPDVFATTSAAPDTAPPSIVSDLAVVDGSLAKRSVTLQWTAPGDDGVEGQAFSYDLRSSVVPMTEAVWQTASTVPGLPAPQISGTVETVRVDRLSAGREYHFRMKTSDERGNISPLSNELVVYTPRTGNVRNFSAGAADSAIAFAWEWPDSDAFCGAPVIFEARVSNEPISETNWNAAQRVALENVQLVPGGNALWILGGLAPGEVRSLAIRVAYEEGCLSEMQTATGFAGGSADVNAPAAIGDLHASGATATCVTLGWAAPSDDVPSEPVHAYEIRYADAPLTEQNFANALEAPVLVPASPGSAETLSVCGLEPATLYYFALRVADEAGNLSPVSNVVSVTTSSVPDASAPSSPAGLEASCESGVVTLTWSPNAEPDLASYVVQRTSVVPPGETVERTTDAPSFVDRSIPRDAVVIYHVFAVDVSGNRSAASEELRVTACAAIEAPAALRLGDPWPNPFRVSATIPLDIPSGETGAEQRLLIFDAAGHSVRALELTPTMPGRYAFVWDGRNDAGRSTAPGLYVARLARSDRSILLVKRN